MNRVQVLRIVEYFGPREVVEEQVRNSLHGTKTLPNGLRISATTINEFPSVLPFVEDKTWAERTERNETL